jgi:hypothetical protein
VRFRFKEEYKSGKKGLIPHVIGKSPILIKVKYITKDIKEISVSYTSRDCLEKMCDITIQAFGSYNVKLIIQKVQERYEKTLRTNIAGLQQKSGAFLVCYHLKPVLLKWCAIPVE